MKDKEKTKPTKKRILFYYLILAACLLVIAAVTVTIVFVVKNNASNLTIDGGLTDDPDDGNGEDDDPVINPDDQTGQNNGEDESGGNENGGNDSSETSSATEFISPVAAVDLTQKQDLWYNATLKRYYLHNGVDFAADVGTEVLAVLDGTVTEIYTDDQLYGGIITIAHDNDIVTVYKFIDPVETLSVGDTVQRGEVIATVAAATGIEHEDGAHLHFEVYQSGTLQDPEDYLGTEK